MRYVRLLPLAALAFTLACNEATNTPTAPVDVPSFAAGNGAHFMSLSAAFSGANLVVSFREAGLGNSPASIVSMEATAAGSATYACINGGGKHPSATNKEDVNGPVSASGDFQITKNGSAIGTLTLTPPPSTLVCPNGQTFVLAAVSYSNVSISDLTNSLLGVSVGGGTFSKIIVNLGK